MVVTASHPAEADHISAQRVEDGDAAGFWEAARASVQ
jgi:hypothetical protein